MEETLNNLILEIEDRKDKLSKLQLDINASSFEYFSFFFQDYNSKNISGLVNASLEDYLFLFLLQQNPDAIFDDLLQKMIRLKSFDSKLYKDCLLSSNIKSGKIDCRIIHTLYHLPDSFMQLFDNMMPQLEKQKDPENSSIFRCLKQELESQLKEGNYCVFIRSKTELATFYLLIQCLKQIKEEKYIDCLEHFLFLKTIDLFLQICDYDVENLDWGPVIQVVDSVYQYYVDLEKKKTQFYREKERKLSYYTLLINLLKQNSVKEEITNIDAILNKILEEDLKVLCLKYINEHNQIYYEKLDQEYRYQMQNSKMNFVIYFQSLGINFTNLDQELQQQLMQEPLNDVEEKMMNLGKIFDSNEKCMWLCTKTKLPTIRKIMDFIKKEYITTELVHENEELFSSPSVFSNLEQNIKILLKKKVNLRSISTKQFLLTDFSLLLANLDILEKMNFPISTFKDLSLLQEKNLQQKIDSFVEIGLEKYMQDKPDILNADFNLTKRILLSKLVGLEVMENHNLKASVLDKDSFFISDSLLDSYLLDRVHSNYACTNQIDFTECSMEETDFSYILDGVIIPKARVTNLSVSLEQLIKPSFYSQEEVKKLEKYRK